MKTKDWKMAKEAFQFALDNNCVKMDDLDRFMESELTSGFVASIFMKLDALLFDLTNYPVTFDKPKPLSLDTVRRLFDEWADRSDFEDGEYEFGVSMGYNSHKATAFLAGFKAGMEHGAGGSKTA